MRILPLCVCARFVDSQDNFDGMARRLAINQRRPVFSDGAYHIGDLQSMAAHETAAGFCAVAAARSSSARRCYLRVRPIISRRRALVALQMQIAQLIIFDHRRTLIAVDFDARRHAGIRARRRGNRPSAPLVKRNTAIATSSVSI